MDKLQIDASAWSLTVTDLFGSEGVDTLTDIESMYFYADGQTIDVTTLTPPAARTNRSEESSEAASPDSVMSLRLQDYIAAWRREHMWAADIEENALAIVDDNRSVSPGFAHAERARALMIDAMATFEPLDAFENKARFHNGFYTKELVQLAAHV